MESILKNTETAKNLMRAFAGESQARNRYTFAAAAAKKEGLPVIEAVFQFTAAQEKEHAEVDVYKRQPIPRPKMKIGSSTMFRTAPMRTDSMPILAKP